MATAREGGKNKFSHSLGSEEFYDLVCQPCELDGKLQEAVGLCTDCQEYLCRRCFDVHTLPTPMRNHKLLDKKQMVQRQVSQKKEDKCSEKCAVHEGEVIKYYCIDHFKLCCNDCISINHRSCDNVTYIPRAAKDLASNDEYKEAERQLGSVVKRAKKITENNKQKIKSVETDCVRRVQDFRKEMNEVLNKIEADLVRECKLLKSEELEKTTKIAEDVKTVQSEVQSLKAMAEKYQNNKQNCNLYTVMMKGKETLMLAEDRLTQSEKEQSSVNSQIKFVPNQEILLTLKSSESFWKLSKSGASTVIPDQTKTPIRQKETTTAVNRSKPSTIVRAEYVQDVNVKSRSDMETCWVTGLVALPGNRLFIADSVCIGCGNGNVKLVDVKQGQVITQLKLSSRSWDVAMVTTSQVAVTLPDDKKVAMVNVSASKLTIDRTLGLSGCCYGVDYRDGKLAVSFSNPYKVQLITMQGQVIYTITNDKTGQALFNAPCHVAFHKDNTSLYVSNNWSSKVMHVKFDGTVLGRYSDSELSCPNAVLTDNSGNVYMCGRHSYNIHQITPDCRHLQVLLTEADGLHRPCSISFSEAENMLYVGMEDNNNVKVYRVIRGSK